MSQPAQVSDHPAPTDPELSCTCCCQSSQIQSHHSHPPVSTLAKITERIEYKLISHTYKVLTTTQPSYLHNLITVQPPCSTRSSLVTVTRPSASSLYAIINKQYHFMTSSDRFLVPVRSAVKSNFTSCCCQNLSERALNALTVQASTIELGKLFQIYIG